MDLEALLPSLRERLSTEGALRLTALTKSGIPKARHVEAARLLEGLGFEATRTSVRVPVRAQLLARLQELPAIPLAQLAKALKGTTLKEAKAEAESLATEGLAFIVLRGVVETLVPAPAPVLDRGQLLVLREAGVLAGKALKRARRTVLLADVRERLLDLVVRPAPPGEWPAAGATRTPGKPAPPQLAGEEWRALVLAELARHVRPGAGLAFVPDAVRALAHRGVPNVHAALLDAARAGRIELQPESGLGRLSPEELGLCPPGPQGTRLSWARFLEAAR